MGLGDFFKHLAASLAEENILTSPVFTLVHLVLLLFGMDSLFSSRFLAFSDLDAYLKLLTLLFDLSLSM